MSDKLENEARNGAAAIDLLIIERNSLKETSEKQSVDLALAKQCIDSLKQLLTNAEAERDHYMRHCVELTTTLNDAQMLIRDAVNRASQGAYRNTKPPIARVHQQQVNKELTSLVQKINDMNGKHDDQQDKSIRKT